MRQIAFYALFLYFFCVGCSSHRLSQGRQFNLSEVSYSDLEGWKDDDFRASYPALERACIKPAYHWIRFCEGLKNYRESSSDELREYIESELKPYCVKAYGSVEGKITGYYEAELTGSRTRLNGAQIPIYGLPANYDKTEKYDKRVDIEEDGFDAPVIAWADDSVDLFLTHVQGSGRMKTPDGEIHLGFAGSNNRAFTGIGQIIADEGLRAEAGYSMVQMRTWLKANPKQAQELMKKNDRYIFFREIQGETPVGTAGVALTPRHSVAVDNSFIPMNTPMWLKTNDPDGHAIRTLVVAQDTGAAIKGGIRADYFFGHGENAFNLAGRMNTTGAYYLLLPD